MEDPTFNDWEASMESLHCVTKGHATSHMPNVVLKAKKREVQCTRNKHALAQVSPSSKLQGM